MTVDGVTHRTGEPFIVIATENPAGSAGTQLLPESQLDRFMICVSMGYPTVEEEMEILKRDQKKAGSVRRRNRSLTRRSFLPCARRCQGYLCTNAFYRYIAELAKATGKMSGRSWGLSPRGTVALTAMAKACAWMKGREYVIPADVQEVFPCVAGHRIFLNMKARGRAYPGG